MRLLLTHITTALRQLTKNAGRSFLTMLGIIIGIGSVIFIMTVGEVAKNFLLGQLTQFGTNVVEVAPPGTFGFGGSDEYTLTDDDVEAIENSNLLPEIEAVSAGYTVTKALTYEGSDTTVTIFADRPAVFDVNNLTPIQGRLFTQSEFQNGAKVVVIGEKLSDDTFNGDAVGEKVKIGDTFFQIIGVVEDLSVGGFGPPAEIIFAPLTTVREAFLDGSELREVSFILAEFAPGTNVDSFTSRLEYVINEHNDLLDTEGTGFLVVSRQQALDIFDSVLLGIQAFVSAVAAISLIVGGIGIMNIMLVTVKERTKEIGLRKAIGATNGSVLAQFLIESVVLTTVGGIIGVLGGLGLSMLAVVVAGSFYPDWNIEFVFVPQALVIATGVAMTVGIIFGLYPAIKASRLHPIEALRYE